MNKTKSTCMQKQVLFAVMIKALYGAVTPTISMVISVRGATKKSPIQILYGKWALQCGDLVVNHQTKKVEWLRGEGHRWRNKCERNK